MSESKTTILIGQYTIERLRRGEMIKVQGVTLAAADDLFKRPKIAPVPNGPIPVVPWGQEYD